MRLYNFYTFGELDDYGVAELSEDVKGQIKIAINISSQGVQDNINYHSAQYVGLTLDKNVTDKTVINYNGKMLKVLYVNPKGRYTQVFMSET